MSTPSLYVPLRTGDIIWPNATAEIATTDVAFSGQPDTHPNSIFPTEERDNQYGYRDARGTRTVWKKIDLSSLMQGATRPRTFKIMLLERNILADKDLAGNGFENPQIAGLLFDTYLSVDSLGGGSNDKRLETHYSVTNTVATMIGTSVNPGFHTGRIRYQKYEKKWYNENTNALSESESREGTFTVEPNFPFINIGMYIDVIFPLDNVWTGNIGPINAMAKITVSEGW